MDDLIIVNISLIIVLFLSVNIFEIQERKH